MNWQTFILVWLCAFLLLLMILCVVVIVVDFVNVSIGHIVKHGLSKLSLVPCSADLK